MPSPHPRLGRVALRDWGASLIFRRTFERKVLLVRTFTCANAKPRRTSSSKTSSPYQKKAPQSSRSSRVAHGGRGWRTGRSGVYRKARRPFSTKKGTPWGAQILLEAKPGFEPGVKALQASALPLGHFAV